LKVGSYPVFKYNPIAVMRTWYYLMEPLYRASRREKTFSYINIIEYHVLLFVIASYLNKFYKKYLN